MITLVLWLWRDPRSRWREHYAYGPDTVNKMAWMIRRRITCEHEIVCITDQETGFDSDIRIVPLWDDVRELGGCYTRLRAFAPDMAEIIGPRFCWLDIDAVVTGDLAPLLKRREEAVFWRSCTTSIPYNGSMVMMTAGARRQVWDSFDPATSPRLTRDLGMIGTDQAWIAHTLGDQEAVWTVADGVCSFRRDCRNKLPSHSRIVFFPGKIKPNDPKTRFMHPWITANMGDPDQKFDRKAGFRISHREMREIHRMRHRDRKRELARARDAEKARPPSP